VKGPRCLWRVEFEKEKSFQVKKLLMQLLSVTCYVYTDAIPDALSDDSTVVTLLKVNG